MIGKTLLGGCFTMSSPVFQCKVSVRLLKDKGKLIFLAFIGFKNCFLPMVC